MEKVGSLFGGAQLSCDLLLFLFFYLFFLLLPLLPFFFLLLLFLPLFLLFLHLFNISVSALLKRQKELRLPKQTKPFSQSSSIGRGGFLIHKIKHLSGMSITFAEFTQRHLDLWVRLALGKRHFPPR